MLEEIWRRVERKQTVDVRKVLVSIEGQDGLIRCEASSQDGNNEPQYSSRLLRDDGNVVNPSNHTTAAV